MAPDQQIHIDIGGDRTGGDKISTGDISGQGVAVGRESTATAGGFMSELVHEIYRRLLELERQFLALRQDADRCKDALNDLEREKDRQRWMAEYDRTRFSTTGLFVVGGLLFVLILGVVLWLSMGNYVP